MKSWWSLLVLAALSVIIAGCGRPDAPPETPAAPSAAGDASPSNAAATAPSPTPTPPADATVPAAPAPAPGAAVPGAPGAAAPPPARPANAYRIPGAGTDGWRTSTEDPAAFGARIDQAHRRLRGAQGEATLWVRNREVEGKASARIRIEAPGDYEIEYHLPADPVTTEILVGGGGKRMLLPRDGGWKDVAKVAPARERMVREWADVFPRAMFANLGGEPVWAPLISDLLAGKGGHRAALEEKTMDVNGRSVRFFRVIAERTSPTRQRMEMRFDGDRLVPLTIKANTVGADGREVQAQWTAKWAFGRALPPRRYTK